MVVAEEVRKRVDEKFVRFRLGRIAVLGSLFAYARFRKEYFARRFRFSTFREIVEIVERENVGGLVDPAVVAVVRAHGFVVDERHVHRSSLGFRGGFFERFGNGADAGIVQLERNVRNEVEGESHYSEVFTS